MKIASTLLIPAVLFVVMSCQNLDNAEVSPRSTFTKFHEGPYSITASSLEITPDGFIILGNMQVVDKVRDTTYTETIIIKTDERGNRIGDINRSQGGTGKAIKPILNNGAIRGYVVVGDSIHLDPSAEQAANVSVSSLRVVLLDENLKSVGNYYLADTSPQSTNQVREDFSGISVDVTEDGRIIILGTLKAGIVNQQSAPEEPFVLALKSNFTLDWFKRYDLIGRTSQNSKSVHYRKGRIIWASAIAQVQGDFTSSWGSIPVIEENSVYPNYSVLGENSTQLFVPKDIQPAHNPDLGYGVIGTYSKETNGTKDNIFFLAVDNTGNIIPGSDHYFDAIESADKGALGDRTVSSIIDEGEAITSTQDGGFVLAGTITTNPQKGNGGKDIFLIKINAFGDVVWNKTIGGAGDEVPTAIREASSGELIICGTNTIGDYSSVFLMKTDKNGDQKN